MYGMATAVSATEFARLPEKFRKPRRGIALDEEGGLVVAPPGTIAWRFDHLGRSTRHVDCGDDIF